ncbi:MAG: DUF1232 domain-containing protein [Bacteroidales bacterium]|nr:DUF1232 domain-containing protein [Bacteroidales bacterium]
MANQFSKSNASEYAQHYSDGEVINKLNTSKWGIGRKLYYNVLLLWYVLKEPSTPASSKAIIVGALGYFILPLDVIPDFIPALGFTDDAAAIAIALKTVSDNITPEIRRKAEQQVNKSFNN